MLSFHLPALRRDPPPDEAKSLTFHFVVLVLAAVLVTAAAWFFVGSGPTTAKVSCEQAHRRNVEDAPQMPVHPGPLN